MNNIAVLGASVGDEGKGRVVNYFSQWYDFCIRFSGSSNCGHTIWRNGKKYVHHLIPSFDWTKPNTKCFLASGMVINLEELYNEIISLETSVPLEQGEKIGRFASRIYVDPDIFLILPEHIQKDAKDTIIGTTKKGVGPAYESKVARNGKRIKDVLNTDVYVIKLKELGIQFKHVLEMYSEFENSKLLFEGSQGTMLDLNQGIFPFVSCGDSCISGIYQSGFAHLAKLDKVFGVSKCYLTKVGEGPFPTEYFGEEAEKLRKLGNEYGATTGRARRIGALDLPMLSYAIKKSGITSLILTKLDILNSMNEVKICTSYQKPPVCPSDFFYAEPQYITIPGWNNAKNIAEIRPFIDYVENFTNCTVEYISYGTGENDIVKLSGTKETDLLLW